MTMKKLLCLSFLAAGLLALATACNEGVTTPGGSPGSRVERDKIAAGETGFDDPALHALMEDIWTGETGGIHMLATQHIDRVTGGTLAVTPNNWPEGYEVRLEIPPLAFDPSYGEDVLFGVSIPYDGDTSEGSPSYEFFPDGIQFTDTVKVTLCWPPWAGDPPKVFQLLFLEAEYHEMQRHYRVVDGYDASPAAFSEDEPDSGWTMAQRCTEITFKILHFSRWGITSGSDDGDGGGKALKDLNDPVLHVGDSCWTSFPPDPDAPTPVFR